MTEQREFQMTVYAYGLTPDAEDALFNRVADAAHVLDEQVTCAGASGQGTATAPRPVTGLDFDGTPLLEEPRFITLEDDHIERGAE